jgi:hypothetical protein
LIEKGDRQIIPYFGSKHDKSPIMVQGFDGVYSIKRLSEKI